MALATQCPHCQTTFRVAHDQLKLRAGLVRCGACKEIFNGIENLVPAAETQAAESPAPAPVQDAIPAPAAGPESGTQTTEPGTAHESPPPETTSDLPAEEPESEPPVQTTPAVDTFLPAEPAPEELASPAPAADEDDPSLQINIADELPPDDDPLPPLHKDDSAFDVFGPPVNPEPPSNDDPLLRMTLLDVASPPPQEGAPVDAGTIEAESDRLAQTIDALQEKPLSDAGTTDEDADALDRIDDEDFVEPAFVRQGRRRRRVSHVLNTLMAVGSGALLVTLAAQTGYVFRDRLAAWFPQVQPVLTEICERLECQLGLPTDIDAVSIESNELQAVDQNSSTLVLNVLLRNRSTTAQAWPHIELTLNDTNEQPVVRKVFQPRDYLTSAQQISKGFAPRSEHLLKIHFTLAQLKASGYRVYVFYP